jgi:hypothetical protein
MGIDIMNTVTGSELVAAARDLRNEHGASVEYDRALVEITARVLGMIDANNFRRVEHWILSDV